MSSSFSRLAVATAVAAAAASAWVSAQGTPFEAGASARERAADALLPLMPAAGHMAFLTAAWHFSRGLALVATGRLAEAMQELVALTPLLAGPSLFSPDR